MNKGYKNKISIILLSFLFFFFSFTTINAGNTAVSNEKYVDDHYFTKGEWGSIKLVTKWVSGKNPLTWFKQIALDSIQYRVIGLEDFEGHRSSTDWIKVDFKKNNLIEIFRTKGEFPFEITFDNLKFVFPYDEAKIDSKYKDTYYIEVKTYSGVLGQGVSENEKLRMSVVNGEAIKVVSTELAPTLNKEFKNDKQKLLVTFDTGSKIEEIRFFFASDGLQLNESAFKNGYDNTVPSKKGNIVNSLTDGNEFVFVFSNYIQEGSGEQLYVKIVDHNQNVSFYKLLEDPKSLNVSAETDKSTEENNTLKTIKIIIIVLVSVLVVSVVILVTTASIKKRKEEDLE